MKIGIIGMGVVGKALDRFFTSQGFTVFCNDVMPSSEYFYDKTEIAKHQCDFIFFCVQTPTKDGKQDLSFLENAIKDMVIATKEAFHRPLMVIKSTVLPNTTRKFRREYPEFHFAYNPEFLTAKNWKEEIEFPDRIVVGLTNPYLRAKFEMLYAAHINKLYFTTPESAELIKYLSNIFLVLKVAYANVGDAICKLHKVKPDFVMSMVGADKRIGYSHLNPKKGKIPLDSPCLPKDLAAFISHIKSEETGFLAITHFLEVLQGWAVDV